MRRKNRQRVNLSLNKELFEFAQKWSHVTQKPLSHIVDDFLRPLKEEVLSMTPEMWFDQKIKYYSENSYFFEEIPDDEVSVFEEWMTDEEESEYCKKNPNSIRARLRIALYGHLEKTEDEGKKLYKKHREAFIKRWKEVFPDQKT